ncbi:MAG: M56 family metallopeptidase [Myxococcota bacterium]
MSLNLLILSGAAVALTGAGASLVVWAVLPQLDRFACLLGARARTRFWLCIAALPSALGLFALTLSFLPSFGVGHDHCRSHGKHHPHLCPIHGDATPSLLLVVVAMTSMLYFVCLVVRMLRTARLAAETSRLLRDASEREDELYIFPSESPQAFVLGAFEPRIHVSEGMMSLPLRLREAVLAHERVHARRRDPAWRAVFPLLAVGHLPNVSDALKQRVCDSQELAADDEAADSISDGRVRVSEALLALAKYPSALPSAAIAFTQGDIESRVLALLEHPAHARWPRFLPAAGALVFAGFALWHHHEIHHLLESILGALS